MKKKRISFLLAATMVLQLAMPAAPALAAGSAAQMPAEDTTYVVPAAPNVDYNMNYDWKFYMPKGTNWPLSAAQETVKSAHGGKEFYDPTLDDSAWDSVSVPHTFNDGELFDSLAQGGGDSGTRCITFYRKHFALGEEHAGKKIILEFEGVRQAAYLYVNGQFVGYYEAGVDPFGFDISEHVQFGAGKDNIIAVALDNTSGRGMNKYISETRPGSTPGSNDGTSYQWNTNDFNPTVGGLTRDVILHVKNDVYQTLPLYSNLKTMGTYIYGSNYDIPNKEAVLNVEAEVRNESASSKNLSLEVAVVDKDGKLHYSFASQAAVTVPVAKDKGDTYETVVPDDAYAENPAPTDTSTVEVKTIKASAKVGDLHLWSTKDPFLYDVYSIVKDGDTVIDVTKITTGFRKVEAKGGIDGGVYINDELVWLTGYAQRSTSEWAAIGVAPDWMRDWDMSLVRESNANYIRWMHVAAQPADIRGCDKYGIVCIQPAGDKEADVDGRSWDQRVEVMRDTIIYFRNSPSILFWETGNSAVSAAHMQEMTDLRKELDPNGGRTMGCRALSDDQAAVDASEFVGTMLGRKIFNGTIYTDNGKKTRDKRVILESEYYREESPRRVWDDFSPPDFDYVHGSKQTSEGDSWDMTAEDFVVNSAGAYMFFYGSRVNTNTATPFYSGAAALCWTDSIQHGRQTQTENARMSGRVDPVRIKKQSFYAFQVLQSTKPTIYLVGHWNYPTDPSVYPENRDPHDKTVYVLASRCKYVELFINGKSVAKNGSPSDGFVYAFPGIDITQCAPGSSIEAVGYDSRGNELVRHRIETAGAAASVRLTPHTGPKGLLADGSDVAYVDVEIVDAQGRVLPLDYSEFKLELTGPGILRGGYNSGGLETNYGDKKVDVTQLNKDASTIRAECGVNRVFIRSTRTAGEITLTVKRAGLEDASVTLTALPFEVTGGLTTETPQRVKDTGIVVEPEPEPEINGMRPVLDALLVKFGQGGNTVVVEEVGPEIKVVEVYVNDVKVDFGMGASGAGLTAFETAASVYGPVEPLLKAIGAEYTLPKPGDNLETTPMTMKVGDKTVTLTGSQLTAGTTETIINQMAEYRDGVLYAELSAIVEKGFGFTTNHWASGMTELRITLPSA